MKPIGLSAMGVTEADLLQDGAYRVGRR